MSIYSEYARGNISKDELNSLARQEEAIDLYEVPTEEELIERYCMNYCGTIRPLCEEEVVKNLYEQLVDLDKAQKERFPNQNIGTDISRSELELIRYALRGRTDRQSKSLYREIQYSLQGFEDSAYSIQWGWRLPTAIKALSEYKPCDKVMALCLGEDA